MTFVEVAYGVLNAALAVLVLGVRPARTANRIAALLFGLNAAFLLVKGRVGPVAFREDASFALAILSHAPLFALPLVFPVRRLGARGAWVLVGVAMAFLLAFGAARLVLIAGGRPVEPFHAQVYAPVFVGIPAFGAALLAFDYVRGRSDVVVRQAGFLLAAYVLKAATVVGGVGAFLAPPPAFDVPGVFSVLGRGALVAVVVGIVVSRVRGTGRPVLLDLLVLAAVPAGFALRSVVANEALEYLLVRPLLFAYAILRFQLLDVDVRERAGVIAAALLAAAGAIYLETTGLLARSGVDLATGVGVALVVSVGAAALVAWPLGRAFVDRPGVAEPRGREIYVAALGEAMDDTSRGGTSGARVLAALRQRLGISEREHALLEASVLATRGSREGVREGALFLGRFHVERLLGEGGFGRTWLARDVQVGRPVVLKVARAATRVEGQQLAREARLLARAGHPGIVTVYDVEVVGEEVVLVLEYVPGGSLAGRLAQGPVAVGEAVRIASDLLLALGAVHAEGLVHRDVKPANVLLTREGRAKLADFGVARGAVGADTASGLSLEGRHPGSLRYMSPEQVRGQPLDGRSDLYSAAVVLYEMVAGRPYLDFRGRADFDVRVAILEEAPALPLPGVPEAVNRALAAALAKDPEGRPAEARAFRALLPDPETVSPRTE